MRDDAEGLWALAIPSAGDHEVGGSSVHSHVCEKICLANPAARASRPSQAAGSPRGRVTRDRKSTRLNSSHLGISYAVFCLKKKKKEQINTHSRTLAT